MVPCLSAQSELSELVQRVFCTALFWGNPASSALPPPPPGENYIKSLASSSSSIIYNLPWLLHEGGGGVPTN